MEIDQIVYDNLDQEVLLRGKNFDYPLSYPTQAIISFHGLNRLLNYLRQANEDLTFETMTTEEKLGENYIQHVIDLAQVSSRRVDLALFMEPQAKKLICA